MATGRSRSKLADIRRTQPHMENRYPPRLYQSRDGDLLDLDLCRSSSIDLNSACCSSSFVQVDTALATPW
jgi:hypothetical protein